MKHLITGILLFLTLACTQEQPVEQSPPSQEEKPTIFLKEGSLVGLHYLKHRDDYPEEEGERFLAETYFPTWRDLMPGSRVYYLKGTRGAQKGSDVFFWVFESKASRDVLFPEKDAATSTYDERRATVDWLYQDTTFYKYNEGWVDSMSADFEVIAAGDPVTADWLPTNAVVGMHYMKLRAGIDTAEFEQFIHETYAPNRSDAVPDTKVFFLKGIRGDYEGGYAFMWVMKSDAVRDKLFPRPDESSEYYEQLKDEWDWLYGDEYRGKYLEEWVGERQTDYVIL